MPDVHTFNFLDQYNKSVLAVVASAGNVMTYQKAADYIELLNKQRDEDSAKQSL